MFTFISENIGSLLILLAVVSIAAAILAFRIRAKRQGKTSCGCGCASCPMADKCHPKKDESA